jgi:hypothetical protein
MHHGNKVFTDMKQLDRAQNADPASKGTAENHAPKSDSESAENGTMEKRPLIETPPMARRGE